jgi:hypothetical protein
MQMSHRELWTALHGMVLGAGFLLAFTGIFTGLWSLRSEWITPEGTTHALRRLILGTWAMAILAWLTVIVGSYIIYPWYRAKPPAGIDSLLLSNYPKALLISKPETTDWHELGMEWKEHIAWFTPILATAVAYVVTHHGRRITTDHALRRMLIFFCTIAFFSAAVAGLFGALINKAAPTR